jgi:hypothetical protein
MKMCVRVRMCVLDKVPAILVPVSGVVLEGWQCGGMLVELNQDIVYPESKSASKCLG